MISKVNFGGGCINDTIIHLSNEKLPFGGAGNSGMGAYHGKHSYETFSREKEHHGKGQLAGHSIPLSTLWETSATPEKVIEIVFSENIFM